jgi:hypothetical protein
MADSTVAWKGAVLVDSMNGGGEHIGARAVLMDPRTMTAGFTIRPFHSENEVSAMQGAVPYFSTRDEEVAEDK